ncbi:LysR family transcriptional regulator [Gammaproteobacteria bacterium 45_16_T64]|nr:LysR family transcriptional regulator [Gammaproteobacteria bacterium 45_16_T64]
MIERIHLAILREIDRQGTLTNAANQLCLTQSALSHNIKKLEQQINVKLWIKDGRNLRLTPAGRYMLSVSQRILPQLEHAEHVIEQFAQGLRGNLRIGMECHPCYQWLLTIVSPFLAAWPDVDVDVKQAFQFGGIGALFNHDIDLLITPDPLFKAGLSFIPVFDYELVLVVPNSHPLSNKQSVTPTDIRNETLITYPVPPERLDIFTQFLTPNQCGPKKHKTIETTDIMLQMVSAGRGVTALPSWLAEQYRESLSLTTIRLGTTGIHKHIHIGIRESEEPIDYIESFITMASMKSY